MNFTFEYCPLCQRKVHDMFTHHKSSEHKKNAWEFYLKGKQNEAGNNAIRSGKASFQIPGIGG